ncbi:MAG: hypothetical protein DMG80_02550 [Acidobacteria bacterium]|nr:MAG: hypothetical protein DMG80_02550 [Acidobacteriota bacterium]
MADSLYLSLWFPAFEEPEILPRTVDVLRQFPFSQRRPGVTYVAVQPVAWSEPTILEQRFQPGIAPEQAAGVASELLHEDYAYAFEAYWDLWSPTPSGGKWLETPTLARFVAQGSQFEEGAAAETGHVQVDFGLDAPFLYEQLTLTAEAEEHVRNNVHKLVEFTALVEKKAGATGRLLWSESEENLAQKLIARLQRVN